MKIKFKKELVKKQVLISKDGKTIILSDSTIHFQK